MIRLPSGWASIRIEELAANEQASLTDGPFGSNLKTSHYTQAGPRVIRLQNIGDGTFLDERAHISKGHFDRLRKHEAVAGDVVIAMLGETLPRACVVPQYVGPAIVKADCARLRVHRELSVGAYVTHALNSPHLRARATSLVHGVGRPRLGLKLLRNLTIPLAPFREQVRIVEAIDSYFTRLDDALATLTRVQRNLKRYRSSVLKAAVEGRLVPTEAELARAEGRDYEPASVLLERLLAERRRRWEETELARMKATGKTPKDDRWKAKYKEPKPPEKRNLPQLPEGWCWSSLGQMFEVCVGATPSRKRGEYWSGGIPWVSSGEVSFCRIARTRETISEAGFRNSSTKLNPAGSVLLGMIGEGKTRGQAAILDVPACNNQNCAAIWVGKTEMPPEYIYYFLVEQYEVTRTRGSGNNQPALNKSRVQAIPVPVPPAAEARRIVSFVETHESAIEPMGQSARHAILRAGRLRQSILKWAFEGRLVHQDPNDEPASQLLEDIQAEREFTKSNPRRSRRPTARSTKA